MVEITCDDCRGKGEVNRSLISLKITDDMPAKEELRQLQKDLLAIEDKARELIALKPEHAASYFEQKKKAEAQIEFEAQRLIDCPPKTLSRENQPHAATGTSTTRPGGH